MSVLKMQGQSLPKLLKTSKAMRWSSWAIQTGGMVLLSFIEENDLSDKQIYLFCSYGTGGLAGSVEDIEGVLSDGATLSDNVFDVYEEGASSSKNDILNWLLELGY